MAQIKIYGLRSRLRPKRAAISEAIHRAVVSAFDYPPEKRFHRFIMLDADDFLYPADRSQDYTIIEISVFAGRSLEAKKSLIRLLYANLAAHVQLDPQDVEITIFETPRENWGIRGMPGDELTLNYRVDV